jgi:hypothetical protein
MENTTPRPARKPRWRRRDAVSDLVLTNERDSRLHANYIEQKRRLEASRTAVFKMAEILEHILSLVPRADILTGALQVNRLWKRTIENSPTIKILLWHGSLVLSPRGNKHDLTATEEHRRVFSCESNFQVPTKQAFGVPIYSGSVELNEHLFSGGPPRRDLFSGPEYKYGVFNEPIPRRLPDPSIPRDSHKEGVMSWAYSLGDTDGPGTVTTVRPSFLDMFITSPPITTAQITVYMWSDVMSVSPLWVCASVYDRRGITYARAAEAIKAIKRGIPARHFGDYEYMQPMICFVADGKKVSVEVSEEQLHFNTQRTGGTVVGSQGEGDASRCLRRVSYTLG